MKKRSITLMVSFLAFGGVACVSGASIAALAEPSKDSFPVKAAFVNYDGTLLYETSVGYGSDVVYPLDAPTRPAEEAVEYRFAGWDKPLSDLRVDTLFRATYDVSYQSRTATFVNIDGAYLWSYTVRYGDAVEYGGPTPTYSPLEGVTYEWVGWDKPLDPITRDTTFVATYRRTDSRHLCRFYDAEGNVIKTEFVVDGASAVGPSYFPYAQIWNDDHTQSRSASAYAWDHDLDNIRADMEFHPVFPTFAETLYSCDYLEEEDAYRLNYLYEALPFTVDGTLTLPQSYRGKPIIGASGYFSLGAATRLIVPDGYRSFGRVEPLSRLASVSLPASLKTLDAYAFEGSSALAEVSFRGSPSLERIEDNAFASTGLAAFPLPDSVIYVACNAFSNTSLKKQNAYGTSAEYVDFGDGHIMITRISDLTELFNKGIGADCIGIHFEQIHDQNGVARITTSLQNVNFGSSTRFLEGPIIDACIAESLKISLPASMRSLNLGGGSWRDVAELRFAGTMEQYFRLRFNAHTYNVQKLYVDGGLVTEVVVPAAVTEIPANLFRQCRSVNAVTFHEGVTAIGDNAFEGDAIASLSFPESLQRIGYAAFQGNNALSSVDLPVLEDRLGAYAFSDCYNLQNVFFRNGLTDIPNYCFYGDRLDWVDLPSSLKKIGNNAFPSCSLNLLGGMEQFLALDNELSDNEYNQSDYRLFFSGVAATSIVLPEELTAIRANMFRNLVNVEEIQIPGAVSFVGDHAFARCKALRSLSFPATLRTFSGDAFEGCESLSHLDFGADNPSFLIDEKGDVYNHKGNVLLWVNASNSGAYAVRDGVTEVGNGAFALATNVTAITFPASVAMIGSSLTPNRTLESVRVEEGTTVMGNYAFSSSTGNTRIVDLYLPASLRNIDYALSNITVEKLHLPYGFGDALNQIEPGWLSVQETYYEGTLASFADEVKSHTSYWFGQLHCREAEEYVACTWDDVKTLTSICYRGFEGAAFEQNEDFVSSAIRSVEHSGLSGTNLQKMTLSHLGYAASYAFANNGSLQFVDLRGSSLPYLNPHLFENCDSLKTVLLNEGVRHIGDQAFYHWSDMDTTLQLLAPKSLQYVDGRAFRSNVEILLPEEGLDEAIFAEASMYLAGLNNPRSLTLIPYGEDPMAYDVSWKLGADGLPVVTRN